MKKISRVLLVGIFFVEGMMFYNYHFYAHHIEQAQNDLSELEQVLEGGPSVNPLGASVLGVFTADDSRDMRLKHLSRRIVNSTERAIENADDLTNVTKLKTAIDEIAALQVDEVTLIRSAMEKVETQSIGAEIEASYNTALDLKQKVEDASKKIQIALDNNIETIEINIITSKDKGGLIETETHEEEVTAEVVNRTAPGWSTTEKKKTPDNEKKIESAFTS